VRGRPPGPGLHIAAHYNYTPEALQLMQRMYPRRPDRKRAAGRTILAGDIVNIEDLQTVPEYATDLAVAGGWRGIISVPMLREGKPIGTIGVIRERPGRFSDAQVELLRTVADQAVIAIENVRLFTELEARNAELADALARQTATAEVLSVISRSHTDIQPVFASILDCAVRLCAADLGGIWRIEVLVEPPDWTCHVWSPDTFLRYRPQALAQHRLGGKRPRHHRGQRNHSPEAPMTPGRRSHRRDGSAAVQRVGLFPAEPFDNAVAVVVQRQRHRHGNGREQDHLEVVARLGPSTLR
jgi:GAF domain